MGELSSRILYSLLYWMMVNDVRRCWAKFYFHQTFDTTPSKISFVLRCENLSWICFTSTCNNLEHMHVQCQYQKQQQKKPNKTLNHKYRVPVWFTYALRSPLCSVVSIYQNKITTLLFKLISGCLVFTTINFANQHITPCSRDQWLCLHAFY